MGNYGATTVSYSNATIGAGSLHLRPGQTAVGVSHLDQNTNMWVVGWGMVGSNDDALLFIVWKQIEGVTTLAY